MNTIVRCEELQMEVLQVFRDLPKLIRTEAKESILLKVVQNPFGPVDCFDPGPLPSQIFEQRAVLCNDNTRELKQDIKCGFCEYSAW